jgi:hypothetical protein
VIYSLLSDKVVMDIPEKIVVTKDILKPRRGARTTLEKRRASTPVQGKVKGKRDHYSEKEKINAVCVYTVSGNSRRTAEITKIPEATIRAWKTTPWWNEISERIYLEQDEEISSKLTQLVDKAVDAINDRLQDGDYVYNPKLDKLVRKPMSGKEIATVTAMAVDKRQLLRGKATSRTEKVSTDERMKALAMEFKKFTQAKQVESVDVIDA